MTITKATIEDIPQLEILINSAYRGDGSKKGWTTEAHLLDGKRTNVDELQKIIDQPHVSILKYHNDDNEIIACVYLKKNDDKMYLGMLTVSPEIQAHGIGKKLLFASEEFAMQNKCDAMQMTVISVRSELIAWYQRHGYHDTGKRSPFEAGALSKQLQPLEFIYMEKKLP